MAATTITASRTTSAVGALGKISWRLAISLPRLNEDENFTGSSVRDLSAEIEAFGAECDLLSANLEEHGGERGRSLPMPIDSQLWACLVSNVEEACRTIHELELLDKRARGEGNESITQAQRPRQRDSSVTTIATISTRVVRHKNAFRLTLLLTKISATYLVNGEVKPDTFADLSQSQTLCKSLMKSSDVDPESGLSHAEVALLQYAQEVLGKCRALYEADQTTKSPVGIQYLRYNNSNGLHWMQTLEVMRLQAEAELKSDHLRSDGGQGEDADRGSVSSEDDLETDLVKAALDTGAEAFDKLDWKDAFSMFSEGLKILEQLSSHRRRFCNIFSLHYKLAICTYHTQEPDTGEQALLSFIRQTADTDEQRLCIFEATHLLSQLYVRTGQIECAKAECEKALQARRRLLGKQSDASLESLALMAHIYVLLDNRARAKTCLAMIPEERRDDILASVEAPLGSNVKHLNFTSLLTPQMADDCPEQTHEFQYARQEMPESSVGLGVWHLAQRSASTATNSPSASPWSSPRAATVASMALSDGRRESTATDFTRSTADDPTLLTATPSSSNQHTLSRKEILDRVGCHPRDRTEEAVCGADLPTLIHILTKKKGFWRSSIRKRVRPERVTALHFAALFGEIDMARRLIDANFNVNEIPFGYSTSITPLQFATGARQVDMVEFLIAHGAGPCGLDTWSSLAGQLMSRSWLKKTLSESERDFAPHRIISIMNTFLKKGWDVDAPIDASGKTVLHQAVSFWTGAYQWDLMLRAAVTTFLCERGADAFRKDKESKTPYDLALLSGHQDLLLILDRGARRKEMDDQVAHLAELPS